MLGLWISKIRIWIWSKESTLSVDFMDLWSVFGFAPKKRKIPFWIQKSGFGFSQKTTPSTSSSGPSQLGETTGVQIYFLKGDIKKNTYQSDIQLTSIEILGKSKLNELAIFYYL